MKTSTLFVVASFLATVLASGATARSEPETLKLGAKAPPFALPGVDGKTYQLSDFDRHAVLAMIFTCNHCPTAQAYEDRMKQLAADYGQRGVGFVAISPNSPEAVNLNELGYSDLGDSLEEMKIRARDAEYNFPYLYDGEKQEMTVSYGPVATPHAFVFDRERRLRYVGRLDGSEKPGTGKAEDMRAALDALLAGEPVASGQTKTFGCSIKWAWKNESKLKTLEQWSQLPVTLEEMDDAGVRALLRNDGEKLRLINIWATWCGPCVTEFPEFIMIDRMYRHRDFEFVSVSADKLSQKEKALKFLKSKEASNRNYIWKEADVYALIEAVDPNWQGALPYTVLVEPGGAKIYARQGTIDPLEVKRAIVGHRLIGRYY